MPDERKLALGLIGCGAFGQFCLETYWQMPQVRIAAVADVAAVAADAAARKFSVPGLHDPAELIGRDDVDIVHIATPPASHHELAMAALTSGKHVLCEKPLAINVRQADEMLAAGRSAGRIIVVNFVLRYNAVTDAVKAILDSKVLGEPLSARITNCAADTNLPPEHWFWDKSVSGGIFIEHGVHFFDLYAYWFGPGRVIDAHAETRPATRQEDRVMCTVRHDRGTVASHYHGFDQLSMMDRTDHRIVCECGDIRVDGWIPLRLSIDAALDAAGVEKLASLCPGCTVETLAEYGDRAGRTCGRGKTRNVDRRVRLEYCPNDDKQAVYTESVRSLLADQIALVHDPHHHRVITEANGRDAVALAEAAAERAALS